jgi:hypothetical protein
MLGLDALASESIDPGARLYQVASGYLDLIEVPLRLTAHAILGILDLPLSTRRPLHDVEKALKATRHPVAGLVLKGWNRGWRNAIAHRRLHWDETTERVVFDKASVEYAAFAATYLIAYSVHQGFEAGVALARAASAELRTAMGISGARPPAALRDVDVRMALGAMGVAPSAAVRRGTRMTFTIPTLTLRTFVNLCAGLLDAAAIDPNIDQWAIEVVDREQELVIGRDALLALHTLTEQAAANGARQLSLYDLAPVVAAIHVGLGSRPDDVAEEVRAHVMVQAFGECKRLENLVRAGNGDAARELAETVARLRRALHAAEAVHGVPLDDLTRIVLSDLADAVGAMAEQGKFDDALWDARLKAIEVCRGSYPPRICEPWPGVSVDDTWSTH